MKAILIIMVGISFLTAMLTAGRESDYGVRDEDLKDLK